VATDNQLITVCISVLRPDVYNRAEQFRSRRHSREHRSLRVGIFFIVIRNTFSRRGGVSSSFLGFLSLFSLFLAIVARRIAVAFCSTMLKPRDISQQHISYYYSRSRLLPHTQVAFAGTAIILLLVVEHKVEKLSEADVVI